MLKKFFSWQVIAILGITLVLALFDAPNSVQNALRFPEALRDQKINLGLDLQGGSQLDYKIDLRSVPEEDREKIVDGVLEVINKRVNGLGVAEPNIYTSSVGDETHIIVELANTAIITQEDVVKYLGENKDIETITLDEKKEVSLQKAKDTVGKTIQLEFKERKDEVDPEEIEKIRATAQTVLDKILAKNGENFAAIGREEALINPSRVKYETADYKFADEITPEAIKTAVSSMAAGTVRNTLVSIGGTYIINDAGETQENTAVGILKLVDVREEVREDKKVEASHILIAYKDAANASDEITRTKEEALTRAKEAEAQLKEGKTFTDVAKYYSDDPSNKDSGGKLSAPVAEDGTYVKEFQDAALELTENSQVSDIIETEFGYHIIKADNILNNQKEKQFKYELISFSTMPDLWQDTGLTGKNFKHADVQVDQYYQPYISIQFDEEGAKLFEEITEKNVGKPVAIFVGGEKISSPRVNEKITGGSAQITGSFTQEEASNLARDLNTGAIPAPIVLTGETSLGATLGADALNASKWSALIAFFAVALVMIAIYRFPGVIASIALAIYGIIMLFLVKSALPLVVGLPIALIIFGVLVAKTLNSKDGAGEKIISFILSCVLLFFIVYILKTSIVLTLAGVAGIILSVGMAVDANVLIFARIREEIRSGKSYTSAVEEGFFRAWSSIRDSNYSTLITCAILFYFGSSLIKGFAFNLAAGVLVSMFTAITITKTLMLGLANTKITKDPKYFGINLNKPEYPKFNFIKSFKKLLGFSGILTIISILAIAILGVKLGQDFTGGTLMEFKFDKEVTKQELQTKLIEIQEELKEEGITSGGPLATKTVEETITIDFKNASLTQASTGAFMLKSKYMDSATHDKVVADLEEEFGNLNEQKFTTVGATIGSAFKEKALIAILIASLGIIIYVAFAFRKVPKELNPWRFGVTAIIAVIHDLFITMGFFVILGAIFNVEIDALFITAMLTVLGYSVNDTIVVFDRTRENAKLASKDEKIEDIVNKSLNQTLWRSLNTVSTTLVALIVIFIGTFFGAESIRYFILALIFGIGIGAYSSIFVATAGLVIWKQWSDKRSK